MSDIVRITKGQPFAVFIPLVVLNADGTKESVAADTLTNISVTIKGNCGEQEIKPLAHDRFLVLNLPADLQVAVYAVSVTATLWQGRQFSLRIQRAFEVVNWDWQSNWRDYLVGDHIELNDQLFIAGYYNTDAELEHLKEEYRQKIAETAEAKLAYETSKATLDVLAEDLKDVSQETTSQAILHAVGNIDFSILAKQGSNINATNTAILDALSHISPTDPNSLALAQFFGVTLLEGYEFMQDTEVCDELEDIMQVIDPNLTAAQAAAITAQTLNPSES